MTQMLGVRDVAARYGVDVKKARAMMLAMPCLNLGTEKRKVLMISEDNLTKWENARSRVRAKDMTVPESVTGRRKTIRINEFMNPDGTCKRRGTR